MKESHREAVDKGPQRSKNVLGEALRLADLQEGEVDVEYFAHQRVVPILEEERLLKVLTKEAHGVQNDEPHFDRQVRFEEEAINAVVFRAL